MAFSPGGDGVGKSPERSSPLIDVIEVGRLIRRALRIGVIGLAVGGTAAGLA